LLTIISTQYMMTILTLVCFWLSFISQIYIYLANYLFFTPNHRNHMNYSLVGKFLSYLNTYNYLLILWLVLFKHYYYHPWFHGTC